jgi:SAM-dependent methyltransferase
MPRVKVGHYVLGTQGLALLRSWLVCDRTETDRLVEQLGRFCALAKPPLSMELDVPRLDVETGYARWSKTYDGAPNPLIRCEEPVVRALIDAQPIGMAADLACGTGRHTAYLLERGHAVVGIDASAEMLARAHARIPHAELREGRLDALPLAEASIDLAICALALTHVRDLDAPITQIARVLRPGGCAILSDLHPTMVTLGGTGLFVGADGSAGNVDTWHHPHGRYLSAFRAAGLEVAECAEPSICEEDLSALSGGLLGIAPDAFRRAWLGVPSALIWRVVKRSAAPAARG